MADMNFLGNPTFYPPKEFTGTSEHFEGFSYELRAYMTLINPGYSRIFKEIDQDPTNVIQYEELHGVHQYAHKTDQSPTSWLQKQTLP